MDLCEHAPELRKKLAVELVRQPTPVQKVAHEDHNYMIFQSLMKIGERGPQVLELIGADADELEDWQEFKIHMAAEYLDAVYDSIRFRLQDEED